MPKFILATAAALLPKRGTSRPADAHHAVHDAKHAETRSRDATRRLHACTMYDPYVDLAPLDLTRRH